MNRDERKTYIHRGVRHEELRASELQTTHVDLCTYTAAHAKTHAATSGGLGH